MKKVQEVFKQHGDWFRKFGMVFIAISLVIGLLSFLGMQGVAARPAYVPFHDLKTVRITNVIYSDSDSGAYVEGIADGNRKIHIDVDGDKIPSNFKNTKHAVVYESADKEFYLNQKDYDENNPKVSKADAYKLWAIFIGCMIFLSIIFSAYIATVSI